ncbi:MAG: hypothetical protein M3Y48_13320 [Actinomycetota bacterium]|nr:hypothetical protein [Actinomycetota bacterium]
MGEVSQQLYIPKRDWRVHCYDADGVMRVCTIDSDHGAVRIGLTSGEREQYFELRAEQADRFWTALETPRGVIDSGDSDQEVRWRWQGRCYSKWGEQKYCLIEGSAHDAVRIVCEWECAVELRGDQIGKFQAALAEAMKVCHTDAAIHGEHWADDEADETEAVSPRGIDEAEFVEMVNEMVAAEAPKMFALVAEIGDRVDAMITVWCVKLPDRIEVISVGSDGVRGIFHSVEHALKLLSAGGKTTLRLVSVAQAQRQVKAT